MAPYIIIILISWAAFFLFWIVSAFNVKRDVRGGGMMSVWYRYLLLRVIVVAAVIFVALRISTGTAHYSTLDVSFARLIFAPPVVLGWIGAACAIAGVAFAIWARVYLGRNWSPAPAVKEDHELVTGGPYAYVRHPIYTGVILIGFGSALTGSALGLGIFVVMSAIFLLRVPREERIMLELFPNQYPAYQARTKRLIPFIW